MWDGLRNAWAEEDDGTRQGVRDLRDLRDFRDLRVFRVFRVFREAFGVSQKKRTFALNKDSKYFFSEDSEYFF